MNDLIFGSFLDELEKIALSPGVIHRAGLNRLKNIEQGRMRGTRLFSNEAKKNAVAATEAQLKRMRRSAGGSGGYGSEGFAFAGKQKGRSSPRSDEKADAVLSLREKARAMREKFSGKTGVNY